MYWEPEVGLFEWPLLWMQHIPAPILFVTVLNIHSPKVYATQIFHFAQGCLTGYN